MRRLIILLSLIFFIAISCVKTEPVSTVPEITFERLEALLAYDSLGNLKTIGELEFSFIDGDANIGVAEEVANDTALPDTERYNLFLIPYSKVDSIYSLIEYDSIPPYYSIIEDDKLERVGQNKTIKGTITLQIEDLPQYDTIRYDFYIRDRAGNNSNIETTTDIGTYIDTNSYSILK